MNSPAPRAERLLPCASGCCAGGGWGRGGGVYRAKARGSSLQLATALPAPLTALRTVSDARLRSVFTFSLRVAVSPSGSLLLPALSARLACSGHSHQTHESLGLPCPGPLAISADSHSCRGLLLPKRTPAIRCPLAGKPQSPSFTVEDTSATRMGHRGKGRKRSQSHPGAVSGQAETGA